MTFYKIVINKADNQAAFVWQPLDLPEETAATRTAIWWYSVTQLCNLFDEDHQEIISNYQDIVSQVVTNMLLKIAKFSRMEMAGVVFQLISRLVTLFFEITGKEESGY